MASGIAMTRRAGPARVFWGAVHRWAGLATALFLIVSGLTGAVLSWEHDIDEWLNADLFKVESRGPYRQPTDMAAAIQAWDPRVTVSYLSLSYQEGHSATFFVRPNRDATTGRPYKLDYNQVFVDPVTAKVLGKRDSRAVSLSLRNLMPFVHRLHYTLHVPPFWGNDRWGEWLMGGVALIWLFDSMVGFYLTLPASHQRRDKAASGKSWWTRWQPAWRVRRGAGSYKLNFDLHRAFGLWTWGVLVILSFTSFSINLRQEVFEPLLSMVSKKSPSVTAGRPAAPLGTVVPARYDFEAVIARARAEAQQRGWTTPMSGIFYNARYGFYNVSFFDRAIGGDASNMNLSNLYIDAQDLRLLGDNEPWVGTAADVFGQLQLPLHSGRILGLPGRLLMSAMGLVVAMLSVTGLVIWWRKRGGRRAAKATRVSEAAGPSPVQPTHLGARARPR